MSSSSDPVVRDASEKDSPIKGAAKTAAWHLQKKFRLFPKEMCLISGPPRSGTSILDEWLGRQPGVSAIPESRILVSVHAFMNEVHRFQSLDKDSEAITCLARRLAFDYYSNTRLLMRKRLIIDKEPLEPIAFPSKDYGRFIANMKMLFPDLKLLFAIRDPIATIWSMSRRAWGESLTKVESKRFSIEEHQENWSSVADLVLKYSSDPNTYIVQFGRLVHDPENESKRIFEFLKIRKGRPFQPRRTKEVSFKDEERERILHMVQPKLELLEAHGISNLG